MDRISIKEIKLEEHENYYIPCSSTEITKRMLTNLIYSFRKSDETIKKNDLKEILNLYV